MSKTTELLCATKRRTACTAAVAADVITSRYYSVRLRLHSLSPVWNAHTDMQTDMQNASTEFKKYLIKLYYSPVRSCISPSWKYLYPYVVLSWCFGLGSYELWDKLKMKLLRYYGEISTGINMLRGLSLIHTTYWEQHWGFLRHLRCFVSTVLSCS